MNEYRLRELPIMTYLLLIIQILVFAWELFNGGSYNSATLIDAGAKVNQLVQMGQWWRLLTPIFVHIGWSHLLINSLTLYFVGILLERVYGAWRFLLIYLLSGLGGNLMSFAFGSNFSVAAGASTSLFGLFGVFVSLGYFFRTNPALRAWSQQFLILIVFNLVADLFMGQIDIWGHIGGVLSGALLAGIIAVPHQSASLTNKIRLLCITGVLLLFGVLYYVGMGR
ncbi:rhomboid family intramembrane serine protease [Bombilactobacillus folatiphilus]|uniref:Rhomboid family intramembrane serine protease n=1 Tax=Bombilactobacillus folatiphilus TaxID=2923362 RepID=A0ABY4PA66_9LACO|nr:rhomboid family intramembrane serine protease [Bombilactobacillus folatiphilus]UQS82562.1 rhomboid family intramembrane serine protease [Bombilactobacillus folatiphilus]